MRRWMASSGVRAVAASETTQISVRVLRSSPARVHSAPKTVSVARSMNFFMIGSAYAVWFTRSDAPGPGAGPGQVVVAVHAAGICGTDVHATQGLFPWKPPLVLGHEYTGVVRAVGRGVSRSLVGRLVGCEPSYGCGKCAECAAGRVSQCPQCVRVGGFAECVVLPVGTLHALPRALDPVTAAMTEPAACCLAGLEGFPMPKGATVLVIGG